MTKRPPTEDELRAAVRKQMRFLVSSGNLVAQGDYDEAVRLAVSLRVLLHDTRSSRSVLGQLGWKHKLQYVNSLRPLEIAPGIIVSLGTDTGETVGEAFGLVVLRAVQDGGLRYVAPLGEEAPAPMSGQAIPPTLPFANWWSGKALYSVGQATFSRWDLIDQMAHKDGGAHLDLEEMTPEFREYKLRGAGVVTIPMSPDQTELPQQVDPTLWEQRTYPGDAASPTVLQIAWELLETLARAELPEGPAPA
ncbi:hypothetical protein RHODO2019_18585 (plasmid) [Rhodococcus antarcticus]|uniref:Uncharacterized protein n=1 Tax=Rhodococcus antarcticus TaxID=2987751 RepID=A0ABY6P5Q1_9NOCA|nr:hypothetical protein [Rhodococcus antarcticus]UZJ27000.1 hypothetical protein RHODO2019_18585 [Rhodococcus antarcticus]